MLQDASTTLWSGNPLGKMPCYLCCLADTPKVVSLVGFIHVSSSVVVRIDLFFVNKNGGLLGKIFARVYGRLGRFPPVVKTAVPVDGRFEHMVLSCNATSDHAIIWIERESQRALDVSIISIIRTRYGNSSVPRGS